MVSTYLDANVLSNSALLFSLSTFYLVSLMTAPIWFPEIYRFTFSDVICIFIGCFVRCYLGFCLFSSDSTLTLLLTVCTKRFWFFLVSNVFCQLNLLFILLLFLIPFLFSKMIVSRAAMQLNKNLSVNFRFNLMVVMPLPSWFFFSLICCPGSQCNQVKSYLLWAKTKLIWSVQVSYEAILTVLVVYFF